MIRKFFGVRRRSREEKKCNFKKKVLSAFFRPYGAKKTECVWVGICVRVITAEKR